MFKLSTDEEVAERYFSFVNDVIGILALTLAATALQFEHPEPFAMIFTGVILLWSFSKGGDYRRIGKRYVKRYPGFVGGVLLLWRLNIYIIGVLSLVYVATGFINTKTIYLMFGL